MSAAGEIQVGCEGVGLELGEKTSEDAAAKGKSAFPMLETPSHHGSRNAVTATHGSASEAGCALPQSKAHAPSRRRTTTPPPGPVREYAGALEEAGPARGAVPASGEKRRGVSASGGRRKPLSPG